MATVTTDWKLGTTTAAQLPGTAGWSNQSNALSDSDADAAATSTITDADFSRHLRIGFANVFPEVPEGATNIRIEALVRPRYQTSPCFFSVVSLGLTTTVPGSPNKSAGEALTTSFADYQFGGDDAWGLTLDVDAIQDLYLFLQFEHQVPFAAGVAAVAHAYLRAIYDIADERSQTHRNVGDEPKEAVWKTIGRRVG